MCSILREKTYPERLLFEQGGLLLLLRLLLELIVAHGHDGEDEVDEVEAAEEDDEEEEDDVPRSRGPQHGLVKVFPVILNKVIVEIFLRFVAALHSGRRTWVIRRKAHRKLHPKVSKFV